MFKGVISRMKKLSEKEAVVGCANCSNFDFRTLKNATADFSNKIAAGSRGPIYLGTFGGEHIVVKCLNGNQSSSDFYSRETEFGLKIQHRNICKFLGFCLKGSDTYLVYEYLPNGSLDDLLKNTPQHPHFDWSLRIKIIKGIACGLRYLHEEFHWNIIHRDIKPSNILLDKEMNPKITGMYLSKFLEDDYSKVTTQIVGTFGYIDPEYLETGRVSVKTDVYSFGVLFLEIITGQRVNNRSFWSKNNDEDFMNYVWRNWNEGTASNLIDPSIRDSIDSEYITRCIQIGLLCVQRTSDNRPTMNSVVHMIECESVMLPPILQSEQRFHYSGERSDERNKLNTSETESANHSEGFSLDENEVFSDKK